MGKLKKIFWSFILVINTLILILFILFILFFDVSGSVGLITYGRQTFLDKIKDYFLMRIGLLVELFPYYIIPLIVVIALIIFSKRMLKKMKNSNKTDKEEKL